MSKFLEEVESLIEKNIQSDNEKAHFYSDGTGAVERCFFRGENDNYGDTSNVASIFRKEENGKKYEYLYTNEYMRSNVNVFNKLNDSFSKLTYMQHFGLPTRLIVDYIIIIVIL